MPLGLPRTAAHPEIIERDIVVGKYFVTGDLTTSIYRDDCRFKDPTNDVRSLQRYLDAVSLLFDPQMSTFELTDIRVSGPNTVEASWLLAGYLKFPWHPVVQQFAGTTKYTVDGDGLIEMHEETWSISPLTALHKSAGSRYAPLDETRYDSIEQVMNDELPCSIAGGQHLRYIFDFGLDVILPRLDSWKTMVHFCNTLKLSYEIAYSYQDRTRYRNRFSLVVPGAKYVMSNST
eukprot:jgi/Mesvir1/6910/Mv09066-RA.1